MGSNPRRVRQPQPYATNTVSMLLAGGCIALVPSAETAAAADNEIIVTGARLEESLPQDLAGYGARLELVEAEAVDRGGYNDISQVLQTQVPGLYVAPKSGAFDYVNVALLGSRNGDILWLVDGVRIANRLYNTTTPLDTLPAHMVERIEVLKGGQGLFYGTQAVAGVINVVTKGFSTDLDGGLEVGVDTNDGRHVNAFARDGFGDHAFVIYASHDEADGFQPFRDIDYQPSATDRERGYDVTTVGAKYAYAPSAEFKLSLSYQHTDGELEFAYAEDVAEAFNARNEDIASVKLDWMPRDNIAFYLKAYWHDWDSMWTRADNVLGVDGLPTGDVTPISTEALWRFEDRGINLVGEFDLGNGLTALAGYDYQKYDGRDDEFLIGQQSESVHAPFAQLRLDSDWLAGANLAAGVRYNAPEDGQNKTVWNLSGRVNVNDAYYVRAQVGTSFRLPDAYELYVVDPCCETGNPNLVGEESFNAEVAVGHATDRYSLELIGFRRTVKDLIDIDFNMPAFPDGFLVNTEEKVKVMGAELVASALLGEQFRVTFDYTHSDSEFKGDDRQIRDIPRDLVKFIVNWTGIDKRYGLGMTVNYVGDVEAQVAGVGRVAYGNYAVVDLNGFLYIDADQHHRLSFRLENLLDETYTSQVRRTRRDVDNTSYGARALGTPLTAHVSYALRF